MYPNMYRIRQRFEGPAFRYPGDSTGRIVSPDLASV